MGNYTQFTLSAKLKKETPIEILVFLKDDRIGEAQKRFHKFFTLERADCIGSSSSAYHPTIPKLEIISDDIGYNVLIVCDFKNHNNEIQTFLEMISPYVLFGDATGYMKLEKQLPSLIYFDDDENCLVIEERS